MATGKVVVALLTFARRVPHLNRGHLVATSCALEAALRSRCTLLLFGVGSDTTYLPAVVARTDSACTPVYTYRGTNGVPACPLVG